MLRGNGRLICTGLRVRCKSLPPSSTVRFSGWSHVGVRLVLRLHALRLRYLRQGRPLWVCWIAKDAYGCLPQTTATRTARQRSASRSWCPTTLIVGIPVWVVRGDIVMVLSSCACVPFIVLIRFLLGWGLVWPAVVSARRWVGNFVWSLSAHCASLTDRRTYLPIDASINALRAAAAEEKAAVGPDVL